MAAPSATLQVGRDESGYVVRVTGRGTMRESPAFGEFAIGCLNNGDHSLIVDLQECEYLDSTFLGCLVKLHRQYSESDPPRFAVSGTPADCRRLLEATHLNKLLHIVEPLLAVEESWVPLETTSPDSKSGSFVPHPPLSPARGAL